MNPRTALITWMIAAVSVVALAACSSAEVADIPTSTEEVRIDGDQTAGRDPDAVALAALGDRAAQRARQVAPDATLRQLDLKVDGSQYTFRFADYTLVRDIDVFVPAEDVSPEDYRVVVLDGGYLTGHQLPEMELEALRVGPGAAEKAALDHWQGCNLRSLSLSGEGKDLYWYVFCDLPQGVVSGTVDNLTGIFTPSLAPPAIIPSTATPSR